ncbi:MAG: hypothetical protein JXA60_02475 [Candidatus Coatesbacteria bacterium]|nr:hypothetical protein [Candidatus Coatesbacteria bacterium]
MIILLVFILIFSIEQIEGNQHSQEKNSIRYKYLKSALEKMHQKYYDESLAVLDSLENKFPDNPSAYFFKAMVYEMIMQDMEDNSKEKEFIANVKKCQKFSNDNIYSNNKDLWAKYYLGSSYGLQAIHLARNGALIGAFRLAYKGYNLMKQIIDAEPEFYDAYGGMGMFLHWKDIGGGILMKNTDTEKYLRTSIEKGLYSYPSSMFVLLDIYYQKKDFTKTEEVAKNINKLFPRDPWPYYILSICSVSNNEIKSSIDYLNLGLNKVNEIKPISNYNLALFNFHLAKSYKTSGDVENADKYLKLSKTFLLKLSEIPETKRLKKEIKEGI